MTNTAKENIFARLRSASPAADFKESDYTVLTDIDWAPLDRIKTYRQVTQAVKTQVIEVTEDTWLKELKDLLIEKNINNLMFGATSELGKSLQENWRTTSTKLIPYDSDVETCKETLFSVDAGITTSLGAIAQTGSLILSPSTHEPRLLSLTPPIHIAIVKADCFFNTFAQAIETQGWENNMPTNLLLISGPSKTADIEQELCYGVHGPKELIVFIIH